MDSQLLERFVNLLAVQTGIATRLPDRPTLVKIISERTRALSLDLPEHYYAKLRPGPSGKLSVTQMQEWQSLVVRITTGESYFFRDRGQFALLETKLLPAAIAARRQQAARELARPTLKIWSAGCSTGEELYSLAIVLVQLLPDWERWDLQLIGTDINQEFLQVARQGCYGNWSFRQVPSELRARYFRPISERQWKINPKIRKLARFRYGNLLTDNFCKRTFQDCDLIVCRNVFIYFATPAIASVLEKFKANLRLDGYLLCGHTELRDCDTKGLAARMFPASMVYQRAASDRIEAMTSLPEIPALASAPSPPAASARAAISLPRPVATEKNTAAAPPRVAGPADKSGDLAADSARATAPTWAQAEALFQAGETEAALAIAERLPPTFTTLLAIAGARADRGELDRADRAASAANRLDPEAIAPLQLLAHIAEERHDLPLAKRYWRQAIYLKPEAIAAYLELAAILQREGNLAGAQKQWQTARELLKARLPTESIDCGPDRPKRTVAWLLQYLGQQLAVASNESDSLATGRVG